MEELKKTKLVSFANDPILMDAVFEVVQDNFLKERSSYEVYVAAAERIAVDLLKKAWRELENYKLHNKSEDKASGNVGL